MHRFLKGDVIWKSAHMFIETGQNQPLASRRTRKMNDPLTVLKCREVSDGTPSLRPTDKKGAMASVIQETEL